MQITGAEAYLKSIPEMYVLQSLQGQLSGFHFLILFLKTLNLEWRKNYLKEHFKK